MVEAATPAGSGQGMPARTRVYFSALDKAEKPVLGLKGDDFELKIDGRRAPLAHFRAGLPYTDRSIPLIAWILLDFNPNVNAGVLRAQSESAAAIFDLFHPDSAIGVKLVSDRVETLAPLRHDPSALRNGLARFGERRFELDPRSPAGTVILGRGGVVKALDTAIDELAAYAAERHGPAEVHQAILIVSDANVDPAIRRNPIYEKCGRNGVFLYPVFMPRSEYGSWVEDYFELARKTAGVASVFGALVPGSNVHALARGNSGPRALMFNFIHMARDLNGKYSFALPASSARLSLESRIRGVRVRLQAR